MTAHTLRYQSTASQPPESSEPATTEDNEPPSLSENEPPPSTPSTEQSDIWAAQALHFQPIAAQATESAVKEYAEVRSRLEDEPSISTPSSTQQGNTAAKTSMSSTASPAKPVDMDPSSTENRNNPLFTTLKGKISHDTLKAITVRPFQLKYMSAVQTEVLPLLPELVEPYSSAENGETQPVRDLLVKAKTGTGKTLAFLVPAIEARLRAIERFGKQAVKDAGLEHDKHLEGRARKVFVRTHVGALIISPTRELATQIANEALRLSHHHDDFEVRLLVGGMSKRQQLRDWMKGRRDIVVATPGRLRDFLDSEPAVKEGINKAQMVRLSPSAHISTDTDMCCSLSSMKQTPCWTWASGTTSML